MSKKTTKTAKAAKQVAKAPAKKTAKKTAAKQAKVVTFPSELPTNNLKRADLLAKMNNSGMTVKDIVTHFKGKISAPTVYQSITQSRLPKEVREAIVRGDVRITAFAVTKTSTDESLIERMKEIMAERKERSAFLAKAGFEGGSKITNRRKLAIIQSKLEKLQKSKALKDARGVAVLAFIKALGETDDVDKLVASFAKK